MKPRIPQLALRLDAAIPDPDAPWRGGGRIAYLGAPLTLVLDTASPLPARLGSELHLPLPPAATPRQIRDAAESWLRDEALRLFCVIVEKKSAATARRTPRVTLAFGKGGDWVRIDGGALRCHWRLIEQPEAVVTQVLEHAVARAGMVSACDDLFALA